jgi:hypothetical protein
MNLLPLDQNLLINRRGVVMEIILIAAGLPSSSSQASITLQYDSAIVLVNLIRNRCVQTTD